MADTMKAVDIKGGKGSAEDLFINSIEKPKVTPGNALVKIKAFGINRMDIIQRVGRYPPLSPLVTMTTVSGMGMPSLVSPTVAPMLSTSA